MTVGTLYPPILDTTQPAFISTGECKVYFNINSLNTIGQYNDKLVQIKVTDNRTGKNVLREDLYPNAIKFVSLDKDNPNYIVFNAYDIGYSNTELQELQNELYKVDIQLETHALELSYIEMILSNIEKRLTAASLTEEEKATLLEQQASLIQQKEELLSIDLSSIEYKASLLRYKIQIVQNNLIENGFPIDNYYKVQIRFTAEEVSIEGADPINSQWFVDNIANFSAWSNACLVRAIDQPIIQINDLTATENIIKTENFSFVGTLSFNDQNELDSLASYRIRLYDAQNNLLENSGLLSPESNNTFNYNIKRTLNHGEEFNIKLNYTTSYGYTEELNYKIIVQISFNSIEGLDESTIAAEAIPELGAIRLSIVLKDAISTMRKIGQINL